MASVSDELARYPIDAESAIEMGRLTRQAQLITRYVGLYPEQIKLAAGQTILDIGCGPGEWVVEMAVRHPTCEIVGLDISQRMVEYARSYSRVHRLSNTRFLVGDARQLLPLPDQSFDMINARVIMSFQSVTTWPVFLSECYRLLRPGGIMCSTEVDNLGITSSRALARYSELLTSYNRKGQHCFTEEGPNMGIQAVQAHLFQQSGFVDIKQQMYVLNYSSGMAAFPLVVDNFATAMSLLEPALLREQLIDRHGLMNLHTEVLAEMHMDNFCAIWPFQAVWGGKPSES
jgi:ubiquinone/menaquinone biosynthesis C-methylase UbiE